MERPHHLVVFVLDDMTMPDKKPWQVVLGLDSRDLAGIGDDRILETGFTGLWRSGLASSIAAF